MLLNVLSGEGITPSPFLRDNMVPIHHATIIDGNLRLENPQRYELWLALLNGKQVEVVVRKKRKKRSNAQNRYYWAVVIKMIADFLGYAPEECHEAMKIKFLGLEEDRYGLQRVKSSATLSTEEFIAQFTEPIKRFAAEFLKLYIPDPGEAEPENDGRARWG